MEFKIHTLHGIQIAELLADTIAIRETQDALDMMANVNYNGCGKIVIREQHLVPEFFDLKSRMAGEILQKFSTYRVQLAIVGDFSKYQSKSLKDFLFESNKIGHILFVDSLEAALNRLAKL